MNLIPGLVVNPLLLDKIMTITVCRGEEQGAGQYWAVLGDTGRYWLGPDYTPMWLLNILFQRCCNGALKWSCIGMNHVGRGRGCHGQEFTYF